MGWLRWKRPREARHPVMEFGDRIAELNPDLLEPPSDRGDWSGINRELRPILAGLAVAALVLGLLIITALLMCGGPPEAEGVEYRIEAGPGQAAGTLLSAGSHISFPALAPWLSVDTYGAAIRRGGWHGGAGLDLVLGTPAATPWAEIAVGRAYFQNPTERIAGPHWWHVAGRLHLGNWSLGLHHWSNGGARGNQGENFLTFGWTW